MAGQQVLTQNTSSSCTKLTVLFHADCLNWIDTQEENSYHGVVTDPPYGIIEYTEEQLEKRKSGKGGVWRIPPSIGGSVRQPLPRFTILDKDDLEKLYCFFLTWANKLKLILVPGSHILIASSLIVSDVVSSAMRSAGYEKRGEIARLVRTLRGGDRPKGANDEFPDISVIPRSCWEPWLLFRKPFEGKVSDNLRKWKTGGLRRLPDGNPFPDVLISQRTPKREKNIAPHPSLKPQSFLRQIVWAMLPFGEGVLLDPFAGSGSTLAAAEALGYRCNGVEINREYYEIAIKSIPMLAELPNGLQQAFAAANWIDQVDK
ncbi:MAG TPA: DNA methyltransferase [Dehalococcoidales bacterium]|nr:DNA methyltransferase [Dehalococcoidales bacterium]